MVMSSLCRGLITVHKKTLANTCFVFSCWTGIDNIRLAVKKLFLKIYLAEENERFFFI